MPYSWDISLLLTLPSFAPIYLPPSLSPTRVGPADSWACEVKIKGSVLVINGGDIELLIGLSQPYIKTRDADR